MKALKHAFKHISDAVNDPIMRKGPLPWSIVGVLIVMFFMPFFTLNAPVTSAMGGYLTLGTVPIAVAALLLARKGSLITFAIITLGMILYDVLHIGFVWKPDEFIGSFMGFLGEGSVALVAGQFRHMSDELASAKASVEKQALTDGLTGLPNHRAVNEQLEREMMRATRIQRPLSLVFFDGDRFKWVNDTYGHAIGDVVLRQLGERVSSVLRGGDTLGRYGGEEFVVVLPETDAIQAELVAERMRAAVAASPLALFEVDGGVNTTISIGIATMPQDGETIAMLLHKADQAMYWAKKLGRNRVCSAVEIERINRADEILKARVDEEAKVSVRRQEEPEREERGYQTDWQAMIYTLIQLIEARNGDLSAHAHAVSELAATTAQEMQLDEKTISLVATAALLHDIGKLALPQALLQKPDRLTASEWVLIKQHPDLGAQLLESNPLLQELVPSIRHHHERWDGTGYPGRFAGEDIPLEARIITVAEAFDAMCTTQPYRPSRSIQDALNELERCSGTQFDPEVVAAFVRVMARRRAGSGMLLSA